MNHHGTANVSDIPLEEAGFGIGGGGGAGGGSRGHFSLILPREQSRVVIKVYKVETTANFTRMYMRLKSQSETRAFSINNFALKYKQKCDEDNAALMFISPKTS